MGGRRVFGSRLAALAVSGARAAVALALLAGAGASTARAQDTLNVIDPDAPPLAAQHRGGPPDSVVREAVARYNDSATTRFYSSVTLASGTTIRGDVAMYRGSLRVQGRIQGRVTVINGSLVIGPGAEVEGEVLVIGGRLVTQPGGRQTGGARVYEDAASVARANSGLLEIREKPPSLSDIATARRSFQAGKLKTTLVLETGRTYNRVIGLPILLGPTFSFPTPNQGEVRFDVRGELRTETEPTNRREDFGFLVRGEWETRGSIRGGIGGSWTRQVDPIEEQPLGIGEVGWATFLFGRDYRDYYEQQGAGGWAFIYPIPWLRLEGSVRNQKETSVPASDPISIFRDPDPWRPNPLIDDGHFTLLRGSVAIDTRNNPSTPTSGWYLKAWYEGGTSNDVAPVTLPVEVREPVPTFRDYTFQHIGFDLRKYQRINTVARANLRVTGGGWVGGDPLPVQRRVSLGGPDILAGYAFRNQTCAPAGFADASQAALCDRMLAVQAEIRFRFRLPIREKLGLEQWLLLERLVGRDHADVVLFGDMGKAWLTGDGPGRVPNNRLPVPGEFSYDAGIGLDIDGLALYAGVPIGQSWTPRFTLRLERRF